MEKTKDISLNWFGRSGRLFKNPPIIIEFMGFRYGDSVNYVTAEYLICGICCEHSVAIMGQENFIVQYGDEIVKVSNGEKTLEFTLKNLWEYK